MAVAALAEGFAEPGMARAEREGEAPAAEIVVLDTDAPDAIAPWMNLRLETRPGRGSGIAAHSPSDFTRDSGQRGATTCSVTSVGSAPSAANARRT